MARNNQIESYYGWYPDWLVNWYTGSNGVDLQQTVEVFNTVFASTGSVVARNYILEEIRGSWSIDQQEELYQIYQSSSMQREFSGSLGL